MEEGITDTSQEKVDKLEVCSSTSKTPLTP